MSELSEKSVKKKGDETDGVPGAKPRSAQPRHGVADRRAAGLDLLD
jgi:hypothetical protein